MVLPPALVAVVVWEWLGLPGVTISPVDGGNSGLWHRPAHFLSSGAWRLVLPPRLSCTGRSRDPTPGGW